MKIEELCGRSVLVLGLGQEGLATRAFLQERFPGQPIGLADQAPLPKLSPAARTAVAATDPDLVHLGPGYLDQLTRYELIIKSPGIPRHLPRIKAALAAGVRITSQTEIFFAECPGTICGVTGTKGKSTTSSLIHAILLAAGRNATLVGNIGVPPLYFLAGARPDSVFVYELSSHQLDGLTRSPHVAVVLNIVPEHLDYYESFAQYVAAKENISRWQHGNDWLVYNAAYPLPRRFAAVSAAHLLPFTTEEELRPGCFLSGGEVIFCAPDAAPVRLLAVAQVPLRGAFNLQNVLAAAGAACLLGATPEAVARGVTEFRSLPHRLQPVGTYEGITFYDDSLATVPEATMAALDALAPAVETVLVGGFERHLDFTLLARRLLAGDVQTLILFPKTGERIAAAVDKAAAAAGRRPGLRRFFVETMEEAVALAYRYTRPGKICLHSPASPSFGLFENYKDRGEQFQRAVCAGAAGEKHGDAGAG